MKSKYYRKVGADMVFPDPHKVGDICWTLTYGKPSKKDLLVAASVISAYRALISKTQKERNYVCGILQKEEV